MTFSIGTTPAAASPLVTASKTPRKLASAVRGTSPNAARTASSANAPGSPAYATGPSGAGMARSVLATRRREMSSAGSGRRLFLAGARQQREEVDRLAIEGGFRAPEEIALAGVVAQLEDRLEMVRGLDALGHDPVAAGPRERAERLEDRLGGAVGRAGADERQVDLEDVVLHVAQEA